MSIHQEHNFYVLLRAVMHMHDSPFCASSDENAVLARVFEEHRDNEKNCFRVGKRWMHCHIEVIFLVNILAVQH